MFTINIDLYHIVLKSEVFINICATIVKMGGFFFPIYMFTSLNNDYYIYLFIY
jgi:hypothetical protein